MDIYCDGSARGTGDNMCGGYGVAVINKEGKVEHIIEQQTKKTTNNREELKGLIAAVKHAKYTPNTRFYIYSDSAYCVNMFNNWIHSWAKNDWKRSGNKSVENLDLVQELYKYASEIDKNYEVLKIAGHAGVFGNEVADALATNNKAKIDKLLLDKLLVDKK